MEIEKDKSLAYTIQQIEKEYGKGSIMKLGSKEKVNVDYISTGILTLDIALGIGGIPKGRIIEIYGPESSGKTTLCLQIASSMQKAGGTVAFIDAEHALDPIYASKIGVDVENLYISQPDHGEQALEILDRLVKSSAVDLLIVDSVAALVPKSEIEGNMGDMHIGLQARLMSQALRKLTGVINRNQSTVIFINQIRHKIGIMFGSPETTTGGNALKFYASIRMDIRKIESLKKNDSIIGNHVRVKIIKNKLAPPFKMAEFSIIFSEGVSKSSCILDAAVPIQIIKKSGTWYSYKDLQIGQGKENAKNFLDENPEIFYEIEQKVIEYYNIIPLEKKDKEISVKVENVNNNTPQKKDLTKSKNQNSKKEIKEFTEKKRKG